MPEGRAAGSGFVHEEPGRFTVAESWVGAFFGTVLIVGIAGLAWMLLEYEVFGWPRYLAAGALAAGWLLLDVPYALRLWLHVRWRLHPVALTVALREPLRPPPVRVLTATWWLVHLLWGIGLLAASGASLSHLREADPEQSAIFLWADVLLITFAASYVTYGFFLMAVRSLTSNDALLVRLWRYRLLVDALLAFAMVLAPKVMRP